MTLRVKHEVRKRRLAQEWMWIGQPAWERSPCSLPNKRIPPIQKQFSKGLGRPCQAEDVSRMQMAEDLFDVRRSTVACGPFSV